MTRTRFFTSIAAPMAALVWALSCQPSEDHPPSAQSESGDAFYLGDIDYFPGWDADVARLDADAAIDAPSSSEALDTNDANDAADAPPDADEVDVSDGS